MKFDFKKLFSNDSNTEENVTIDKSVVAKPMFGNMVKNLMVTVIGISTKILSEDFDFTPEQIDKFMTRFMTDMQTEVTKWKG